MNASEPRSTISQAVLSTSGRFGWTGIGKPMGGKIWIGAQYSPASLIAAIFTVYICVISSALSFKNTSEIFASTLVLMLDSLIFRTS